MIEKWQLQQRQSLGLAEKELFSRKRIKEYYEKLDGNVYVSFSGGKDSTVLLHLVRQMYPDVPAVFVDTGLEFPEIREFVKTIDNVIWLKPKMDFKTVIETYGYPVVSKEISQKIREIKTSKSEKLINKRLNGDSRGNGAMSHKWKFLMNSPFKVSEQCCSVLKKRPAKKYEKDSGNSPIVGTMASDSRTRETAYLKAGCNSFNGRNMSTPLAIWLEKDIWEYLKKYSLQYSKIYNMGYTRTGCIFCMFGLDRETKPDRFDKLFHTHPQLYRYCMDKLGLCEIIGYMEARKNAD